MLNQDALAAAAFTDNCRNLVFINRKVSLVKNGLFRKALGNPL